MAPHRTALGLAAVGLLFQSLALLPIPLIQGRVLDRLGESSGRAAPMIGWALAASVGCLLVRAAVGWATAAGMHRISLEAVRDLTDLMHRKLHAQPRSSFDNQSTGDLLSRLTSDVGTVLLFLNGAALQLFCDFVLAVGVAILLPWLQWRLAIVAAAAVLAAAMAHFGFAASARRLARVAADRTGELFRHLSERVSAVRLIRAFAREPAERADLDRRLDDHHDAALAVLRTSGRQSAWSAVIGGAGTVGVVAYGALLIGRGQLTAGELLAFLALLAYLYQPIIRLGGAYGLIAGTLAAAERIQTILDLPEELRPDYEGKHRKQKAAPRPAGKLHFRNVSFSFDAFRPPALIGINFVVRSGETVGITGPAGAGKSTLLALACGIYPVEPGNGEILLDGRKLRAMCPVRLRRLVGLVPQQVVLFGGTIRSNLIYAAPAAPEADLWRVLDSVRLADLVAKLPDRLETPVGESGHTLSGGQRQRLALARTLLARPAVLLMDDCTSALDSATEAQVHAAIAELAPRQTRLVVSHREMTLSRCDRVITLEAGRFAEDANGTREVLPTAGPAIA